MLRIDWTDMYSAITPNPELDDTAFLNRATGRVVFLIPNAEGWVGRDAAIDEVFDRAEIDANPEHWVRVPKFTERPSPDGVDEFIAAFLRDQGIAAELV